MNCKMFPISRLLFVLPIAILFLYLNGSSVDETKQALDKDLGYETPAEICLLDLAYEQNKPVEEIVYPSVIPEGLRIPFYMIDELMPAEGRSYLDCWGGHGIPDKADWSIHALLELEKSDWRVFDKDDAAIFVIPSIDMKVKKHSYCEHMVGYMDFHGLAKIEKTLDNYTEYLTVHNVLSLLGDYFVVNANEGYFHETPPVSEFAREVFSKSHKTVFTQRELCHDMFPGYMSQTVNVDLTYLTPDNPKLAKEEFRSIKQHILSSIDNLSYSEWLVRPYSVQSIGQFDGRYAYENRRYLFTTWHDHPSEVPYYLHPYFVHYVDKWKYKNMGFESAMEDINEGKNHLQIVANTYTDDMSSIEAKLQSKFVISLRGDTEGSQHSFEGLMYGALTLHDQPLLTLAKVLMPLPEYIPWVMIGIFDDNECLEKKGRLVNKGKPVNYHECFKEIEYIYNNPVLGGAMHKAVMAYRKDVIFELEGSRATHNYVFYAASNLPEETLHKFNLVKEDFQPRLPPSCQARLYQEKFGAEPKPFPKTVSC